MEINKKFLKNIGIFGFHFVFLNVIFSYKL